MSDSSTLTSTLVPTESEPWFSCLRSDAGDVVCVAAVGELDLAGEVHLQRALHGVDAQVLLAAHRRIRSAGARLVVVRGLAHVQRLFALIGMDRELEFVDQPFEPAESVPA